MRGGEDCSALTAILLNSNSTEWCFGGVLIICNYFSEFVLKSGEKLIKSSYIGNNNNNNDDDDDDDY